jgi:hypothetical protein
MVSATDPHSRIHGFLDWQNKSQQRNGSIVFFICFNRTDLSAHTHERAMIVFFWAGECSLLAGKI